MPDAKVPSLTDMVRQYRDGRRFNDDEVNFRCASLIDAGFVGVPDSKDRAKPDEPLPVYPACSAPCREYTN
ncbi:conserved protein of unknown function [Acidithiobacillus ferrivorans]|uniref:Uncharacterized protein n=1 Tax=Acidithiobacillus ferrivorans TaxID=160808 RepID=A0A060V0C5_9PROT|nr:hypothetical protein [Acidithiobacillus ferrivorans]CDQ12129.1 conserved hypothetical protein [Acidithiobacillus ferrivorans]SMH64743.1 conserved protein of unknown function [Acidithiobacillus ferrivorans]